MSIEQNLERIATALESILERMAAPVPESEKPASRSKSKKVTEPVAKQTEDTASTAATTASTAATTEAPVDDWGDEFTETPSSPGTTTTEAYPEAAAKAVELSAKGFGEVKENFYGLMNTIRDSFGEKNLEAGKIKAREIGYAILDAQIGTRTLTEKTLPSDKFHSFVYATEVARAEFFAK